MQKLVHGRNISIPEGRGFIGEVFSVVLPHGKHCFYQQNMLVFHGRNIFAYGHNVSRAAKLGNIEERCVRSKCFWQHVS